MADRIALTEQTYVLGRVEQDGIVAGWYLVPVVMQGDLLAGLVARVRLPAHEMGNDG